MKKESGKGENQLFVHDSNKNFQEAKKKIEPFMLAIEKEHPGFEYVLIALNPDRVWVLHTECRSIADLIGRIELAKLWKYQKWLEQR